MSVTYSVRKNFTSSVENSMLINMCSFIGIKNTLKGGALSVSGSILLMLSSVFAYNCQGEEGGFVYCSSKQVNFYKCCGDYCVGTNMGQFAYIIPSGPHYNMFNLTTIQRSSPNFEGVYYPICFRSMNHHINTLNSSHSKISIWGSGMNALGTGSINLLFSTFSNLHGLCPVIFFSITSACLIQNCNIANNFIPQGSRYRYALNFVTLTTIRSCVFKNNTYNNIQCDESPTLKVDVYDSYFDVSPGAQVNIYNPNSNPNTREIYHVLYRDCLQDPKTTQKSLISSRNSYLVILLLL